jgi:hypothetical protein
VIEINPKLLTVDTRMPSEAAALHREMKLDHLAMLFDGSAVDGRGLHIRSKYRGAKPKRYDCNRYFRPPSLARRLFQSTFISPATNVAVAIFDRIAAPRGSMCRLNVHASRGCAANLHRGAAA